MSQLTPEVLQRWRTVFCAVIAGKSYDKVGFEHNISGARVGMLFAKAQLIITREMSKRGEYDPNNTYGFPHLKSMRRHADYWIAQAGKYVKPKGEANVERK